MGETQLIRLIKVTNVESLFIVFLTEFPLDKTTEKKMDEQKFFSYFLILDSIPNSIF